MSLQAPITTGHPLTTVAINPRPRASSPHAPAPMQPPVNVSREVLEPLFSRSQQDAAAYLGVSLSSLKSACRRIGISRWPYRRRMYSSEDEGQLEVRNTYDLSSDNRSTHRQACTTGSQRFSDGEEDQPQGMECFLQQQEFVQALPDESSSLHPATDNFETIMHEQNAADVGWVYTVEWIASYVRKSDDDVEI
eukprot:755736-Hanusia_phi.AAC.1